MEITLNGEMVDHAGDATVAGLLKSLEIEPRKIAIERNREIVPKSQYEQTPIVEGDTIEIVQFVGGG